MRIRERVSVDVSDILILPWTYIVREETVKIHFLIFGGYGHLSTTFGILYTRNIHSLHASSHSIACSFDSIISVLLL